MPPQAARALDLDHVGEVGVVSHDRRRRRLDQVVDAGRGKVPPQCMDGRRGEDHVAHQPQADQQDLQGSTVASSSSITGMSSLMG